jgi:hypothetical protein
VIEAERKLHGYWTGDKSLIASNKSQSTRSIRLRQDIWILNGRLIDYWINFGSLEIACICSTEVFSFCLTSLYLTNITSHKFEVFSFCLTLLYVTNFWTSSLINLKCTLCSLAVVERCEIASKQNDALSIINPRNAELDGTLAVSKNQLINGTHCSYSLFLCCSRCWSMEGAI